MSRRIIKQLRIENGYSQKKVAGYIGITQSAYSRIERGEGGLDETIICALAKLYRVTTDYILLGK